MRPQQYGSLSGLGPKRTPVELVMAPVFARVATSAPGVYPRVFSIEPAVDIDPNRTALVTPI